jgi:hypothetical protein
MIKVLNYLPVTIKTESEKDFDVLVKHGKEIMKMGLACPLFIESPTRLIKIDWS